MPTDTSQPGLMPASHEETSGAKARSEHHPGHHLRRFRFDRPQKIAALLLLLLLAQCLRQIARTPLTENDYQYARCGREQLRLVIKNDTLETLAQRKRNRRTINGLV